MIIKYFILICVVLSWGITNGFQGVFWDVCDLHLNLSFKPDKNWYDGNYQKDSPLLLIKSAFHHMKKVYPNPDFIIVNGDNVYHGDENFVEIISDVSAELKSQFPNTIILPSLGNHDVMPRNVLSVTSTWCEKWFGIWNITFEDPTSPEIQNFKKGCYYARSIPSKSGPILVIVLNTMLWYSRNKLVIGIKDPHNQFLWLENTLEKAKKQNKMVFLVGHIPPGSSEYSSYTIYHLQDNYNERLLKIMQNYSKIIHAGFFAHQHTDAFKIVYNHEGFPAIPIYQPPSVTPFRLSTIGSLNPSVRLYYWNNTSENSKYYQYHTLLTQKNIQQPELNWSLEYRSTAMVDGISANYYDNLVADFSLKDSKYFDLFFYHHLSGQPHDERSCPANSFCRCRFICTMKNVDYPKLDLCLKNCSPQSLILILALSITFGAILLLIGTALLIYKLKIKRQLSVSNS